MDDFDALVERAHGLGLKVILDYVPNHTSDVAPVVRRVPLLAGQPERDWFIWRDAKPDGSPPNNWRASFGGGAWEWDEATGQYYYHAYLKEQPDLNWRNPEVREAMHGVLRFWLDRGVDGFRVDALRQLIKDDQLRDNPPNPDARPGGPPYDELLPVYSTDRPEAHEAIRGMRGVLEEYGGDRVLIGELYLPIDRLVAYYGKDLSGVHLPFNFHLITAPWNARAVAALADEYEGALPPGGWPTWVLGNHDRSRIASRVGTAQARVAAMLLLTLRGTPTIYYGDELGLTGRAHPAGQDPGPLREERPRHRPRPRPRTRPRCSGTPTPNAGFCPDGVEPWLPLADDHSTNNVETQREDPGSVLALHRALLSLRRSEPALCVGVYEPVEADGDLLAYRARARRAPLPRRPQPRPGAAKPLLRRRRRRRALHPSRPPGRSGIREAGAARRRRCDPGPALASPGCGRGSGLPRWRC